MRKQLCLDIIIVLALTALALSVRLYRLPEMPFGLYSDEAANGVDVLEILDGHYPIFFERNYGREPLFIYLQAIAVFFFGATPFALRVTAAVIGATTIPAIYWMIREAFATSDLDARVLALWTSFFIALSYWHITLSRLGFRAIMLPLLMAITFAWFWRAWRRLEADSRFPWLPLILCGISLGGALYTYIAARFVPGLILLVIFAGILLNRQRTYFPRRAMIAMMTIGLVASGAFAPLAAYFITHSASFTEHSAANSVLVTLASAKTSLPIAVATHILRTIGMFGWVADQNWRFSPAGRPAFDLLLSAWFFAGIALAIARRRALPYLFAIIWLGILALPALLGDKAPHSLRMIGALPAAYLLAVLAMITVGKRLARYHRWWATWLPLPFLLFSGVTSLHNYFTAWNPANADLRQAFDTRFTEAAPVMLQDRRPDSIWILPLWPVFSRPEPSYILDFLTQRQITYSTIKVGEDQSPDALRRATEGRRFAHLLRWRDAGLEPDGAYALVDRKNLLAFLLAKHGQSVAEHNSGNMDYTTYELPLTPDYRIADDEVAAAISFGGKLKLTAFAYGHTALSLDDVPAALNDKSLPSGHNAWVVLRWQAQQPVENTLETSLFLTDEAGHLAGQVDDPLRSDLYLFRPNWDTAEQGRTYHILPSLPAIPPGRYQLFLAVYDPKTMQRLPTLDNEGVPGANAAFLGYLNVVQAITTPQVQPTSTVTPDTLFAPDIALLGYDLPLRTIAPGDQLPLTLYWQSKGQPKVDYWVEITLRDGRGQSIAQRKANPANQEYLTMAWTTGEVLRGWHDLVIPPTVEPGAYQMLLSIGVGDQELGRASLGNIEISGRPHAFAPPVVRYPLSYTLDNRIAFLGYDLGSDQAVSGGSLDVTLYWQALDRIERSYTVFIHLLDSDGKIWAQQDAPPGQGAFPTTSWVKTEYLSDPYHLALPPNIPIGQYRLAIGMYNPDTGSRLSVLDARGQRAPEARILLLQPIAVQSK